MTKNSAKIKAGIRRLSYRPYEIVAGSVVAGSMDEAGNTISVLPIGNSLPIEHVMLMAISGEVNGITIVPGDNSHVIIGSIDGPGQWTVIKTSVIAKAVVKVGNVTCEMVEDGIKIECNNTVVDIATLIKINTAGESLFALLNDMITAITLLTVGTSSGPSTVPVNSASFTALQTRLGNLLTA